MLAGDLRKRFAAWRRSDQPPRLAWFLWIAWAVIVWNVVFDHIVEVEARWYLQAAYQAAELGGPYLHVNDWMRPAIARGLWTATLSAAAILGVGWIGIRFGSGTRDAAA